MPGTAEPSCSAPLSACLGQQRRCQLLLKVLLGLPLPLQGLPLLLQGLLLQALLVCWLTDCKSNSDNKTGVPMVRTVHSASSKMAHTLWAKSGTEQAMRAVILQAPAWQVNGHEELVEGG